MDKYDIINSSLKGNMDGKITGLDIYYHVKSPFTTYCNAFIDEKEKDLTDLYLELLTEKGVEHEKQVISKKYPKTMLMEFEEQVQGFKEAISYMFKGLDSISNVPLLFLPEGFVGRGDLLVKNTSNNSVFGNFFYEIYEIKIAKNIKPHHILQAAYYNKILGKIQQFTPESIYLINKEKQEFSYPYSEYEYKLVDILKEIKLIRKNKMKPPPTYNNVGYPWTSYSNKQAQKISDITCLVDLGPSLQKKLYNIGIDTIEKVDKTDIIALTNVKGIGQRRATQFKNYATAIINNERKKQMDSNITASKIELFIDFEGVDPTLAPEELGSFDFLFGVIIRDKEKNTKKYYPFFITNPEDENETRSVFLEFIELLKIYDQYPIYHWHSYEKTRIKLYFDRLNLPSKDLDIISKLIDLYKVVRKSWVFPVMSLSLKEVAPYLGFSWSQKQFDGRVAIGTYLNFQKYAYRRDELKKQILDYNEDDIKALIHILDWLIENNSNISTK